MEKRALFATSWEKSSFLHAKLFRHAVEKKVPWPPENDGEKARFRNGMKKSSFSARRVEKVFFLHAKTENSRTFRADLQKK